MKTILNEFSINTERLDRACLSIDAMRTDIAQDFCGRFGLTPTYDDAHSTARYVADAVIRGADSVDKVVGYVRKKVMGQTVKPVTLNVPVTIVGVPIVDNESVTISAVTETDPQTAPVVRHGRGRRKNGKSDFCKAVAVIERLGASSNRDLLLNAMIADGLNKSSAAVYLWRYMSKGERS